MADQSVLFAQTPDVHKPRPIFLTPEERLNHVLIMGMRTPAQRQILSNLIAQDVANGAGMAVIDTTGQFSRSTLDVIPPHRAHSTYSVRPGKGGRVFGFNPFKDVPLEQRARTSQQIMELFKDIWSLDYDRTPLLLDLLRSASRLLLDSEDGTLLAMYPLLTSDAYRQRMIERCNDSLTRRFWAEFDTWPARDRRDRVQPVLTRLRAFLSDPTLRNVLGQTRAPLNLERVVGERQVFLADLDATELGPETARLFACLLVARLEIALAARRGGWPFYIYLPDVDQIHAGISGRLLRSRFDHAGVVAAVSTVDSLEDVHRTNLLSAETVAAFRLVPDDVRHLAPRFSIPRAEDNLPTFTEKRLAVSNHSRELTLPEYAPRTWKQRRSIERRSTQALGVSRAAIERKIDRFINRY